MKRLALSAAVLAAASLTHAQTPAKPQPKPATAAAKPATGSTAKTGTAARTGVASAAAVKLPPGVPPVRGLVKSAFALRYQDVLIGTGEVAEPNKIYEVRYTGWLASDGKKFDSSDDHPDKAPIKFPQGRGRVIPGWDQGFEGMKIGGKRRLFIPYQLAYGAMGREPVIPAKADLIFDIELVSVSDMPTQQAPMRPMPPRPAAPGTAPGSPSTPGAATAPGKPADPGKPVDPAASTATPPPTGAAPSTPPPTQPTAQPDKPANPAQPQ